MLPHRSYLPKWDRMRLIRLGHLPVSLVPWYFCSGLIIHLAQGFSSFHFLADSVSRLELWNSMIWKKKKQYNWKHNNWLQFCYTSFENVTLNHTGSTANLWPIKLFWVVNRERRAGKLSNYSDEWHIPANLKMMRKPARVFSWRQYTYCSY